MGLTRNYVGHDSFTVVLGDNIMPNSDLSSEAREFDTGPWGAGTLLYRVEDPQRFGVAEFDGDGSIVGFEEKPLEPKSNLIPIGVYFMRRDCFDVIDHLVPSGRGELEITDVNNRYIECGAMRHHVVRGWWTDAGTVESLHRAAALVAAERDNPVLALSSPRSRSI
jgi:glucose-1-phosphate thymidylyltransferase